MLGVEPVKVISQGTLRRTALAVAIVTCGAISTAGASPTTAADIAAYADRANFDAVSEQILYTRYIVTYAQDSSENLAETSRQNDFERVAKETGLNVQSVRMLASGAHLVEVSGAKQRVMSYAEAARQVMVAFARNSAVAYVEPDRRMHALLTPNDTNFSSQWDLTDTVGGIRMPAAWDISNASGVRVAVIDTGITPHSDLTGQTVGGYDFVSTAADARDGNGRDSNPNDEGDWYGNNECGAGIPASGSSWHGTHVTGTIAALTNNSKGIAGMAYGAKVVPVRVLAKCGGSVSDIVDAIEWASGGTVSGVPANANVAKVLSLSLGGGGACGSFQAAIDHARTRGSVFVVAAGNENSNVSTSSPANCANVISVAATTKAGSRASYSNFGSTIVVSAPGGDGSGGAGDILSTLNSGSTTQSSETYAFYAGTSMATPHVAALAAAIYALKPTVTPDQVKTYITTNARALPGSCSGGCGAGIIDAQKTLQAVSGGGGNVAPVANFSFTTSGLTATFTDSSSDSDGTISSRSWTFGDGGTSTTTSPSHTYASSGTYSVSLTVTDNAGATNTKTSSVTVSSGGGGGTVLTNGVAVTGLTATTGNNLSYTMVVPAGATNLKFVTSGGSGDGDLYVKFGSAPTTSSYDCRSWASGNAETCNIATAQVGTYYVLINAYATFSGMSLTGSYTAGGGGGGTTLSNGVPVTGLAATTGNWTSDYTLVVPAGATNLKFVISGGTGDADMYVRLNAAPTTATYTCRPYLSGNSETCTFAAPTAGTYHVSIRAYATFSGVTLTPSFTP
jgi:serine protease